MRDGLLELIRSKGHWRVNFRPLAAPANPMRLGECRALVERSSVSLRGWDFPHINHRTDEEGGYVNEAEYIENSTEWSGFNEFWRMYRSTQFLAYVALREDTDPFGHGNPSRPILSTIGTIYQITEIMEFCHRLHANGIYQTGVNIHLSLLNTKGRVLSAGQNRILFFELKSTQAEQIDLNRAVDANAVSEEYRLIAVELCLDLFDRFGWNPDRSQVEADQERFYQRDFQN
jgi:hypothetical protein